MKETRGKLGQYNLVTLALSREKNTDWKLATVINIITRDDKVITYSGSNIINSFLTSSVEAGVMTGAQLKS